MCFLHGDSWCFICSVWANIHVLLALWFSSNDEHLPCCRLMHIHHNNPQHSSHVQVWLKFGTLRVLSESATLCLITVWKETVLACHLLILFKPAGVMLSNTLWIKVIRHQTPTGCNNQAITNNWNKCESNHWYKTTDSEHSGPTS